MKVVTAEDMRQLEHRAEGAGVSLDTLMENAGLAVARRAWQALGERPGAPLVVLVGPGNNGGDGLVAARHLAQWGAQVLAFLCAPRPEGDPKLSLAQEQGVKVAGIQHGRGLEDLRGALGGARLAVDAILGTGRPRPILGTLRDVLHLLREEKERRPDLFLLALDLPSGLNADTGQVDPACVDADLTVTLGYPKMGLFRFPGATKVGRLEVADIGFPPHLAEDIERELVTAPWVRGALPPRPREAHKGTFGRVLVVAGSRQYIGAAYLACMGAARVGAGYVTLASLSSIYPILAAKMTETTHLPLPESTPGSFSPESPRLLREALEGYDVLLMGPGLGQNPSTEALVRQTLLSEPPLSLPTVLDADALNLLARTPRWWERVGGQTVATPHPGEMARLLERSVEDVQEDRVRTAVEAAEKWGIVVVLKGAFSVVASPQGRVRLSPFANPALATAGTGDVLAGAVAGFLAQGLSPFDAAAAGVFLHGAAGERLRQEVGEAGGVASDLLPLLPAVIRAVKEGRLPPLGQG